VAVAALLPDGRVLIAGGSSGGGLLRSAELFDPASDTFTALPASGSTELQTPRFLAVAAPLPDGRVLIAGGSSGGGELQSAELFDPASDTFTALPASGNTELQTPREEAVAAALPDGEVLIAGGQNGGVILRSAELFVPAPEARVAGGEFGAQTVGEPSGLQALTVTNLGAQALRLTGAALAGSDPGDFQIADNACSGRTLAFDQTCAITARFTPTTAGARTATIRLSDNEPTPATITLSGTGVPANSGPQGPAGPHGPAGQVELVVCKTVTKTTTRNGHKHTRKVQKCSTRLVSGTVKFTTTASIQASLTRGHLIYATGTAISTGHDGWQLILIPRRALRPGRYTLTLTTQDRRRVLERTTLTIT
jgi:hypothetical protein